MPPPSTVAVLTETDNSHPHHLENHATDQPIRSSPLSAVIRPIRQKYNAPRF